MRLTPRPIEMPAAIRSSGADTAAAARDGLRCRGSLSTQPVEQCAAAERNADGVKRSRVRDGASNRREHRADLLDGHPNGRHGAGDSVRRCNRENAEPRRASRRAQRLPAANARNASRSCPRGRGTATTMRRVRRWRIEPVEVPEVAVRGRDALASKLDGWATQPIRPDRLRVPAGQPSRRAIQLGRDEDVGGLVVALREPPRRTAPHGMNQAATPCSRASFVRFS